MRLYFVDSVPSADLAQLVLFLGFNDNRVDLNGLFSSFNSTGAEVFFPYRLVGRPSSFRRR